MFQFKSAVLLGFILMGLLACNDKAINCDCRQDCVTNMQFEYDMTAYSPDEIDTLVMLSKFEGFRNFDTTILIKTGNFYDSSVGCPSPNRLVLDKYKTNEKGKLLRVEKYKIYNNYDSFVLDTINVEVLREEGGCQCITSVERSFRMDGKKRVIKQMDPPVIPVVKKQ